jgi:uncharacterized protein (TIGR00290 family)
VTSDRKAWVSWSSGKDSCFALEAARQERDITVVGLLSTLNAAANRVAMHAVRRELVIEQSDRLGLPLRLVEIPEPCPHDVYAEAMSSALDDAAAQGVTDVIFGDLFLEDVRSYRERTMASTALRPLFPLWKKPTGALARQMLATDLRAVVTCVDPKQLSPAFVGRAFDHDFLDDLPDTVDPCGENGEFHTFVWDGPGFSSPIPIAVGEVVEREGFFFADVKPA